MTKCPRFAAGDAVQTPLGKGTVQEIRNNGDLLVVIRERTVVFAANAVSPLATPSRTAAPAIGTTADDDRDPGVTPEIDLHGLTVDEALIRIDDALNAALLAGARRMRFIHGRSGGRIRGALHQRLRGVGAVTSFRLDPRNAGVTIVSL
jgi:DNA mismatch repair protein MutS2